MRLSDIKAGVVGVGFIGVAHVEALRRLGVDVVGVVGSSLERARAKADAANLPRVYDDLEALLADPAIDVVHIATPNHLHAPQVRAAFEAGKHVVCEKPLALDSAATADLVARADGSGLVNAVCFNIRFYPAVPSGACHGGVRVGGGAPVRHGKLPPGLATPRHRLELAPRPRPGRRIAGGRRHRLALAGPGPVRHREACGRGDGGPPHVRAGAPPPRTDLWRRLPSVVATRNSSRKRWPATTALGSCCASRMGPGAQCPSPRSRQGERTRSRSRWTARTLPLRGTRKTPTGCGSGIGAAPTRSCSGTRRSPTRTRGALIAYPGGHVEGYPDTFRALFAEVYADIAGGGPSPEPTYPTFADGHDAVAVTEAIARSAHEQRWVNVER